MFGHNELVEFGSLALLVAVIRWRTSSSSRTPSTVFPLPLSVARAVAPLERGVTLDDGGRGARRPVAGRRHRAAARGPVAGAGGLHTGLQSLPLVINGGAVDIRKRLVSTHPLCQGDDWPGQVFVKTDLNRGGEPEMRYIYLMRQAGQRVGTALDSMAYSKDPTPSSRPCATFHKRSGTTPA